MDNRRKLSIVLAAAIAFSALAGCGQPKAGNVSSAPSSSQTAVSSQAPQSSAPQSEAPVSSETVSAKGNEPAESQSGPVLSIETDDKEFNKKFKDNPIDKAYIKASNNAISSVQMVNISNEYSMIWASEVTSAYQKLEKLAAGDALNKIKAEQTAWLNGKKDALNKISSDAQAAGGTMAQVNEAGGIMDYYRSRAAQVYKELYAYDKNYSYDQKIYG